MHVKITTEGVFEGKRVGAGSVVDVPAEVFEKNTNWMKATDEPVDHKAPAKEKPAAAPAKDGDK